jgi:hypothetical protein
LIRCYLVQVLARDAGDAPGAALVKVCQAHGWGAFQKEIEAVFHATTEQTLERNVRLLERICQAKPGKSQGWLELCAALAGELVEALERIDQGSAAPGYWGARANRSKVLTGLTQALLAAGQSELLARLVEHALASPQRYPLTDAHVKALTMLAPWLKKYVKKPSPALSRWLGACCAQLESLTEKKPQPFPDFRRPSTISCKCADCGELKRFLDDPQEQTWRFRGGESRRRHLESMIGQHGCDVECRTERKGSPHALVCTKNSASYHANVKKFDQDKGHLAELRAIKASLPK